MLLKLLKRDHCELVTQQSLHIVLQNELSEMVSAGLEEILSKRE